MPRINSNQLKKKKKNKTHPAQVHPNFHQTELCNYQFLNNGLPGLQFISLPLQTAYPAYLHYNQPVCNLIIHIPTQSNSARHTLSSLWLQVKWKERCKLIRQSSSYAKLTFYLCTFFLPATPTSS